MLEKVQIPQTIKIKVEQEPESSTVTKKFCRCCFKQMRKRELQFEADSSALQMYEDVIQTKAVHYRVAPSFCNECYQDIKKFAEFKQLAIDRQQNFESAALSDETGPPPVEFHSIWDPLTSEPPAKVLCEVKAEFFDEELYLRECLNQGTQNEFHVNQEFKKPTTPKVKAEKPNGKRRYVPNTRRTETPYVCDFCGHSSFK